MPYRKWEFQKKRIRWWSILTENENKKRDVIIYYIKIKLIFSQQVVPLSTIDTMMLSSLTSQCPKVVATTLKGKLNLSMGKLNLGWIWNKKFVNLFMELCHVMVLRQLSWSLFNPYFTSTHLLVTSRVKKEKLIHLS